MKVFDFFGSYSVFKPLIVEVYSGADKTFTITTIGVGYNYNIKVSDGQAFTNITGDKKIDFLTIETNYIIEITGLFPRWYQNNNSERLKLRDIIQLGDIIFSSNQERAFYGAVNMKVGVNYSPTYENLVNGSFMFLNCQKFNPVNFSPTFENLVDGERLFQSCIIFNPPLFNPKFKSLVYARFMFQNCLDFEQDVIQDNPIDGTINLEDVRFMFENVKSKVIKLQAPSINLVNSDSFKCSELEELKLIEMSISFTVQFSPLLVGTELNNLANSVKDMTGLSSPTVTMLSAQYSSTGFTPTLFTNKNWTISQV